MELEKLENSFINRPEMFVVDQREVYKQNAKRYFRLYLLDSRFTDGMLYKELSLQDTNIKEKGFRFNVLNVFISLFNPVTIERFFRLSPEATLDGIFRGMIFLINNSFKRNYYPLKTTLLEYILHEILINKYPTNLEAGWKEIRETVVECFDEEEYREYFEERKERLHITDVKMMIH